MKLSPSPAPPAVVVHGLAQARLAVAAGPVTLLSAPGAAIYAGCGWWRALVQASGATGPDILDCGDAPGRAMEALRCGCRLIVLDPAVPAAALVAARAAAIGAELLMERPPALNLATPGALRQLDAWLARSTGAPLERGRPLERGGPLEQGDTPIPLR
jgi:hypothetical protein